MTYQTRNRVLRSLSHETRQAVIESCTPIEAENRTILARVGERTSSVLFPETMVISTLATYRDGGTIEMANIGCEACTGISLALGQTDHLTTSEIQVGGAALEMPAEDFNELMESKSDFRSALFATVQAVFYQVMVSGACNGAHGTRERLARWLLTMDDRNDKDVMNLTHDFLAEMLGVRRATISETAAKMQEEGLIKYARGQVRITDHSGLQNASCECYDIVRKAYGSLLPEISGEQS